MKLLSERLEERATFEDERVLKEAKAMGFVPEVYNGSHTGALLREAAAALRAVEGAPVTRVEGMPGTANGFGLMVTSAALVGRRVALVPLDAAGSAEGVS